ncbi:hypothetical protein PRZ48_008097 [Zasmidium cellare]|uniref:SAM and PH domain-containing protein n=1 Tax=Zasmidium cellare TaxID=395010 RepID=A0ABR0EF95_ZASCE|nr:hypothetical protein PRZ48_008097 [Zasmidium cellare]
MQAITPITPLEAGGEMFQRAKTPSVFDVRASQARPLSQMSEATEIFDTDFEDESDYEGYSPKPSFDSEDSRRRSQTTISSYDEAPTPSPRSSEQRVPFDLRLQPVEGPKGPHLFRASQVSADFDYDHALQMSPMLPKEITIRAQTAFSEDTATPVTSYRPAYSLDTALRQPEPAVFDPEAHIRSWSTQQVIDWMYETGIDSSVIECFDIHDINGNVLLDLQFEDLRELDIQSFGKRHQLWNAICLLRGEDGHISPQQTPFQDIDRPCTAPPPRTSSMRRSPSRGRICSTPVEGMQRPTTPNEGKKRRGRKASKTRDIITPAESVSIVAIEQLIPKPHKCAKGERCAKWRKQQRELKQLQDEHGIGRFPISPSKGGRIFVAGDPGNASTAENIIPNVHKQPEPQAQVVEDEVRPVSEAQPSVVASSDLLGPGQAPEFALHEDMLNQLGSRNPQDNVKEFLHFQHMHSPTEPPHTHYGPPSPPLEMFPSNSFTPYGTQQAQPPLQPPRHTAAPHEQLRCLPRLDIPRSASADPQLNTVVTPEPTTSICRSATASPGMQMIYRLGTPASEVDVPMCGPPTDPLARDTSQSVPPNMQYRPQQPLTRSHSRTDNPTPSWRRPSMQLPAVQENEVLSPTTSPSKRQTKRPSLTPTTITRANPVRDPAHDSPKTQHFGYGTDCSHSGWMKKRKTKMLRHEWHDAHFRLKGTQLAMHANARLSAAELDSFNVDDYAVACSTTPSNSKLSAAMKALSIKTSDSVKRGEDGTAFSFQLVPSAERKEVREGNGSGKTHHFAVRSKDERIEWMRELMIAKALQAKGRGFEVEVNGVVQR